jgi:hypothetical protein
MTVGKRNSYTHVGGDSDSSGGQKRDSASCCVIKRAEGGRSEQLLKVCKSRRVFIVPYDSIPYTYQNKNDINFPTTCVWPSQKLCVVDSSKSSQYIQPNATGMRRNYSKPNYHQRRKFKSGRPSRSASNMRLDHGSAKRHENGKRGSRLLLPSSRSFKNRFQHRKLAHGALAPLKLGAITLLPEMSPLSPGFGLGLDGELMCYGTFLPRLSEDRYNEYFKCEQ